MTIFIEGLQLIAVGVICLLLLAACFFAMLTEFRRYIKSRRCGGAQYKGPVCGERFWTK